MKLVWILGAFLAMGAEPEANKADEPALYTLRDISETGTQTLTNLELAIEGRIRAGKEEQLVAGRAVLEYEERILAEDAGLATRVARFYSDARAKFVTVNNEDERQLRSNCRLMVGMYTDESLRLFCPNSPLTADERELIEDVFDTTRLAGLLPVEAVEIGAKWKPAEGPIKAVSNLEHFIDSTLECRLDSVDGDSALVRVVGSVHGLDHGAEVKIKIDGKLTVSLENGLVTAFVWAQNDSREQSPVSPAGLFSVRIDGKRKRVTSKRLTDELVARLPAEWPDSATLLVFQSPRHSYRFLHDRQWHITFLKPSQVLMRQMDGAEFLGQMSVVELPRIQPGARTPTDQFQSLVEEATGWDVEEIVRVENLQTSGRFALQMIQASGNADEIRLMQRHYLATAPDGRRVLYSFVFEPDHQERIDKLDLSIVSTTEFLDETAARKEPGSVR